MIKLLRITKKRRQGEFLLAEYAKKCPKARGFGAKNGPKAPDFLFFTSIPYYDIDFAASCRPIGRLKKFQIK